MNVNVGYNLDRTFKKKKDPHKFALLWSSKFYKIFNSSMRSLVSKDSEEAISIFFASRPNTLYFAKGFVDYFYTYGVYKEQLQNLTPKYLYRGISNTLGTSSSIIADTTFISTSYSIDVARKFTNNKGSLLFLPLKHLPDNTPYVVIDHKMKSYLQEDEVVLLPEDLDIRYSKSKLRFQAKYKLNEILVNYIKNKVQMGGGNNIEKDFWQSLQVPRLSLRGKVAIYYRCVYNRPVEILHSVWFPKYAREVPEFMATTLKPVEKFLEDSIFIIPEYIDLENELQKCNDKTKREEILAKQRSYTAFLAIYNWKTRNVEHYYHGYVNWMITEGGFDIINKRRSIEIAIQEYMKRFETLLHLAK
jgi:hypothetical protein